MLCLTCMSLASDHRGDDNELVQPELVIIPCRARFRTFEPLPEYRSVCPYVLVVASGAHSHPIPLPIKTPPIIRDQIFDLLKSLGGDLADMTPRRFLRHATAQSFLRQRLPAIVVPVLSDFHISLANKSHVRAYIRQARKASFPEGTGWKGASLCRLHCSFNLFTFFRFNSPERGSGQYPSHIRPLRTADNWTGYNRCRETWRRWVDGVWWEFAYGCLHDPRRQPTTAGSTIHSEWHWLQESHRISRIRTRSFRSGRKHKYVISNFWHQISSHSFNRCDFLSCIFKSTICSRAPTCFPRDRKNCRNRYWPAT